jgi:hypothetical protein
MRRLPAGAGLAVAALGVAGAAALAWGRQWFVDYEVALLPWLLRRGAVLYRDVADQHPPLVPLLLALVDGDPGLPLRAVTVGLQALTLALTYAAARRWGGGAAGLGALLLAALWAPAFDADHLWYDAALAPVYLGALWLLAPPAGGRGRALALGALLGAGILLKQHALLAAAPVLAALALVTPRGARAGAVAWVALGPALAVAGAGALLAATGAARAAWYWIVAYSLTSDYATAAAAPPPPGEWPVLAALFAPALALPLAAWSARRGPPSGDSPARAQAPALLIALLGLLLIATLPAWPRYGRYHLAAAVPLCAVAAALAGRLALPALVRARRAAPALLAGGAALALLAWTAAGAAGAAAGLRGGGRPVAPYANAGPLRAWVAAHAAPADPVVIWGLDPLLYRVVERAPPLPWAPQYPWIMAARDTEPRWWAAVARARAPVALVSAGGWALAVAPGVDSGEARLREGYHEAARFSVTNYPGAAPVAVVGLLRNDAPGP